MMAAFKSNAQNQQYTALSFDYRPQPIFEWSNFKIEGSYFTGSEQFKLGSFIKTDTKFKELIVGFSSLTKVVTVSKGINGYIVTSIGINGQLVDDSQFSEPHHPHYVEIGGVFQYHLKNHISIQQYVKKQYSTNDGVIVFGIGGIYKIK